MVRVANIGATALAFATTALGSCALNQPLYLFTSDGTWVVGGTGLGTNAPGQGYNYHASTATPKNTGYLTWAWSAGVQGCFVTETSVSYCPTYDSVSRFILLIITS
jgi:hypothetical protein